MSIRYVKAENLDQISRAMEGAPAVWDGIVESSMYNILMDNPRTQIIRRTPQSASRRYNYYVHKKDGKSRRIKTPNRMVSGNLAKSLIVSTSGNTTRIGYPGDNVKYAASTHERTNPSEGSNWVPMMIGHGRGWTKAGSGNKFVEKPLTDLADWIPEKLTKAIDKKLAENGL